MNENSICRTCLRRSKKCVPISTTYNFLGKPIILSQMIMACAPVVIIKDDGFPSKICENCLQLLQVSFLYRLRVITADANLKKNALKKVSRLQPLSDVLNVSNLNHIYSADYILKYNQNNVDPQCSELKKAEKQKSLKINKAHLDIETVAESNDEGPVPLLSDTSILVNITKSEQMSESSEDLTVNNTETLGNSHEQPSISYQNNEVEHRNLNDISSNLNNNLETTNNPVQLEEYIILSDDFLIEATEINDVNNDESKLLRNIFVDDVAENITIDYNETDSIEISDNSTEESVIFKNLVKRTYSDMSKRTNSSVNNLDEISNKIRKFKNLNSVDEKLISLPNTQQSSSLADNSISLISDDDDDSNFTNKLDFLCEFTGVRSSNISDDYRFVDNNLSSILSKDLTQFKNSISKVNVTTNINDICTIIIDD